MTSACSTTLRVLFSLLSLSGVLFFLGSQHGLPFQAQPGYSVEVVVSHFSEDLAWIPATKSLHPKVNFTIYSKGPEPPQGAIPMKNVGRESHTFLHHIVENYDNLADWTVFTQGAKPAWGFRALDSQSGHMCSGVDFDDYLKPFRNGKDFMEIFTVTLRLPEVFHSDRLDMIFFDPNANGTSCPAAGEEGWGSWWFDAGHPVHWMQEAQPNAPGPIEFYNKFIANNGTYTEMSLAYANGGRFAASRERLHAHPKEFYQRIIEQLEWTVNPIQGYYMEAMWYDLFHPEDLQAENGAICAALEVPVSAMSHRDMVAEARKRIKDMRLLSAAGLNEFVTKYL